MISKNHKGTPKSIAALTGLMIVAVLIFLLVEKWGNEPWYELAGIILLLVGAGVSMVLLIAKDTLWIQHFFTMWLLGYVVCNMISGIYIFLIRTSDRSVLDWFMGLVAILMILLSLWGIRFHFRLLGNKQ